MAAQTQLPLSETLASEMSLFQLDETLSLLMESATEEATDGNGEIPDELRQALLDYCAAFGAKVDNIANYIKAQEGEARNAKVEIERKNDKIKVEIKDFMSPSIIEHLVDQSGTLQPTIDDWRAMVDCVMIDPTYDGQVFNVAISDIPEKKTDFVAGTYELEAPQTKQTVAVKIIDMLGEEVLEIKTI